VPDIHLFVPEFDVEACLAGIRECLERGWTGDGYKTVEFEKAWGEYSGLPNPLFVNSGTAALHLALASLRRRRGWKDGDEIITTPLTFVATNHVILHERLEPVFADVDEYLCLDPESVRERITPKTRAVMFVGMGGNTGRMKEVMGICKEEDLAFILDGAHMAGTYFGGQHAGIGADAACFSFHAVKPLNTADSGVLCVKDPEVADVARKLAWFGINKTTYARAQQKAGYRWRYDVEDLGWKYNGNSIMAAIALAQLKQLESSNAKRRQLAAFYRWELGTSDAPLQPGLRSIPGVRSVLTAPDCVSSRHLYQILCSRRDELMTHLNSKGIYPGVHYQPNTRYRMYAGQSGNDRKCPQAEAAGDSLMSLPLHLKMTSDDVVRVVDAIQRFYA